MRCTPILRGALVAFATGVCATAQGQLFQTAAFRQTIPPSATTAGTRTLRNRVMQVVILAIVVGVLAGGTWWAKSYLSPSGLEQAILERDLSYLRGQYPTLTEAELRQRLAEHRR